MLINDLIQYPNLLEGQKYQVRLFNCAKNVKHQVRFVLNNYIEVRKNFEFIEFANHLKLKS